MPDPPLSIAILSFVIISSLILLLCFLALISSSLSALLLLPFHSWLLYFSCGVDVDKTVTGLCSIHKVVYFA